MSEPIWAPWRIDYILGPKEEGCVFCRAPKEDNDPQNLILYRGKHNFIILNKYPYNGGHLMVVPYNHTSELSGLSREELDENGWLVQKTTEILKARFRPEGFNIGMNIGKAAGAGIDDHLHMHIVPRWTGDTNYMPVIGQTHVIPQHIDETYAALQSAFGEL